jgi:tetratricopeptide (TPR) repeat protein
VAGDTPAALNAQSVCHDRLGNIQQRRGHLADAADHFRRAYEALQRWSALADQNTPALQHNMAIALVQLAGIELRTGRPGESIRLCAEAMRHARAVDSAESVLGQGAQAICKVLECRGDALWANGETSLARKVYAELYGFSSRWVAQQECVESIAAHLVSLQRMTWTERAFGDTAKAYEYAGRALTFALQLHSLRGDTVQAWSAMMLAHKGLGDLEVVHGQVHLARASFQKQLWWAERLTERFGESDDSMLWLGEAAERLGDLEKLTGRYAEAWRLFKLRHECVERRLSTSGKTSELILEMIFCLLRFGDLALAEGNPSLATTQFEEMRDWSNQLIAVTGSLPNSLRTLAISRMRLGDANGRLGSLEQAHGHWLAALSIVRTIRAATGETMEAVRDESVVFSGLAVIERARDNLDAARGWYVAQVELLADLTSRTFESPELVRDLAMALRGLSEIHMARMGERALAMDAAKQSVKYMTRVSDQLASWAGDALDWGNLLTHWTMAGLVHANDVWPLFRELWRGLHSFIDLNRSEVIDRTRENVDAFLSMWMDLARLFAPERLPEVLSARQGRKLLALATEDAGDPHALGAASGEQLAMRYRVLRARLRHLAIHLGKRAHNVGSPNENSGVDQTGLPRELSSSVGSDGAQAVRDLYDETQRELEQCRAELAKSADFEAMQLTGMATEDLQAQLAVGEGLLILVEMPAAVGDPETHGDGEGVEAEGHSMAGSGQGVGGVNVSDRLQAAGPSAHALVLTGDDHVFMALPGLEGVAMALRDAGHLEAASPGSRHAGWCADGVVDALELLGDPVPAPDLAQSLWTPLAPHLQGIHTLHVVTHGELHLLGLQDGAPAGVQVCHYPGLVFYWLQRRRGGADTSPTDATDRAVALQAHSPAEGDELPPIPFVHAEAQALQGLWERVQTPVELDRPQRLGLLHLAGHGQAGAGQDAGVLIGPAQTLGLHELLRSGLKADIVYLSACLVGRTSEDLDGDPLGMLSALFLRGTRQIVAPLVPVSDFHAPLLAILFHVALKGQPAGRLDGHRALHEAKAQLRSGQWPQAAEQAVRRVYAPVVRQAIEGVLAQAATGALDAPNEVGRLMAQWLEPASDFLDVQADERGPVAVVFARGGGAEAGAQAAVELLVRNRHRLHLQPAVQALLRYVSVFGAPGPVR